MSRHAINGATRLLWLAALCLGALVVSAQAQEVLPGDGWEEAVISVSDIEGVSDFFEEVAGFEVLYRGNVDSTRLAYWGLPAESEASEIVLGDPSERRGRVRLVEFRRVDRRPIRPAGHPWDRGGWFGLSLWAEDLDAAANAALNLQWHPLSEPVVVDTRFGRTRSLLLRGPDGIMLTLHEVPEPRPDEQPSFAQISAPFAATAVVGDLAANRDFFREVLGMLSVGEEDSLDKPVGGRNPYGLPANLSDYAIRQHALLHPDGEGPGTLELVHWPLLEGRNLGDTAVAPNLGLVAMRYRVASTTALAAELAERGYEPEIGPVSVVLPPYGIVHQIRLRSPSGADLEFFSLLP